MGEGDYRLTVLIPQGDYDYLAKLAEARGRAPVATVVREAIAKFITEDRQRSKERLTRSR